MAVLVLKKTSDKLDAVLAAVVCILGLTVFGVYLSAPRLTCVPLSCVGRPYSTNCARDWLFLSTQCESTFLSYPDTNFHFLLLIASGLFLLLLSSPIFYGNTTCSELFANFSSIWKLRNNDPVTKEVEWRRRMHLVMEQLKSESILTRQYSIYHGLGFVLDFLTFLLVSLYTLHYFDFSLPTSYFALTKTEDDNYACHMPNKNLYQWFGLAATAVMFVKAVNRFLCVGFALGLPGLFGRNMVLYADEIIDKNEEKVYNIQNNVCAILYHVALSTCLHTFLMPVKRINNYFQFYCNRLADNKGADNGIPRPEVVEPVAAVAVVEDQVAGANGHAAIVEDKKIRQVPVFYHNWSDLLFIMDVMEDNAVDPCDILIFISKSDDLISVLEDKKVDIHRSRLDVASGTVTMAFTDAGIIEKLLDVELYAQGGLTIMAWLEAPGGRVEAVTRDGHSSAKCPTFPITMGTNYEVISAVFGNGKMLARLPNFTFHPPSELKERHKKKYGGSIPLVAFTKSDRPLSLNFDFGS